MRDTPIMNTIDEPRLFQESGIDARIAELVIPLLKTAGFRLVRVHLSGLNGQTLQIMAERADGTMTIEDCSLVSSLIAPVLEVENLIEKKYHLEVSSPGIDRPLVRKSDFFHWQNHLAKVQTHIAVSGRQKFRGTITHVDEDGFEILSDKAAYGEALTSYIPFKDFSEGRLILTDELIREALVKDKALRQQRIPDDNLDMSENKK